MINDFGEWRRTEPYVGEDAIYVPTREFTYEGTAVEYRQFMTREYIVKEGLLNVQDKK